MATLEKGQISIHTENIFPIIKKSLYSEHEIFLRELISNGVDAIQKLKMVSYSGEFSGALGDPTITLAIDKDKKTLTISDNGIGMTDEEIKKYINQVAFSSAEEFIEKYKGGADQPIIGHFGLGFYSSFIVAKQVEIDTLSYKEGAKAVRWICDGSPAFELSDSSRTERGTSIILHLMDEEEEFLEASRIKTLVKKYCDFMPVSIQMDGESINRQKAIWRQSPRDLSNDEYLEFYRYLYPFQEDPLLWVHLNTDYPFLVNGILYFPKLRPDVDVTQGNIKLFCNQVFVSEHCEEIIPKFLLPMRGVIDSPDIPLNVSRSALQADRKVRSIASFIAKKVGDRLKELYDESPAEYIKGWQDLGTFVKFGILNDEKFKKQVEDIVIFRTTAALAENTPQVEVQTAEGETVSTPQSSATDAKGRSYTTLKEYLERNKEKHENRVYYATDESSQASYIQLHTDQGLEVLFMDAFIDTPHFVSFLEREYTDVKFSRVDSDLDESLLEQDKSSEIVDPKTNKTRGDQIKELFEQALNKPRVNVKVQGFKADDPQNTPPAMVLLPEATRRMQEMTALLQQENLEFPDDHVLMVNSNHPLIQNLMNLNQGAIIQGAGQSPTGELAQMICQHVYDLALMAQKGFDANGMKSFVQRSNKVLTELTQR
ncbi:MAG: molecular chaperone HtpG [Prochlorotrichaceae cyanobacterium]|jgi:molecular chaperone HtpG